MDAEIIAIGSELLTAGRIDTNSLFLTSKLNEIGIEVTMKSVVGDDRGRIQAAVSASLDRTPVVIVTGGLGPTEDDVTRDAVAGALCRAQRFDQGICDDIATRFARFGRTMSEINKRQANVIEGAEILPNPNGTAPGQWVEWEGKVVMLLPGPPRDGIRPGSAHCARLHKVFEPSHNGACRSRRHTGVAAGALCGRGGGGGSDRGSWVPNRGTARRPHLHADG
jgi:nicotinamide-nucleotide amidase